ncbi:hypothetical protein PPERSA_12212 [Pseudocohnilembus persalinus]|uniref:Transmembrane protein n=1 Tax=Pseudocohnilembus persalinus TaxID=266149 RepID=A0A0V0R8N7_PSEPJ|nr:hypothetical protein PPERSA_12212 [Pseudocohnilembus persalinus]|eukprot:KRX10861.1 hypothetical protein PPERSA_12212 [Pseudocohnilembus persalinus]
MQNYTFCEYQINTLKYFISLINYCFILFCFQQYYYQQINHYFYPFVEKMNFRLLIQINKLYNWGTFKDSSLINYLGFNFQVQVRGFQIQFKFKNVQFFNWQEIQNHYFFIWHTKVVFFQIKFYLRFSGFQGRIWKRIFRL